MMAATAARARFGSAAGSRCSGLRPIPSQKAAQNLSYSAPSEQGEVEVRGEGSSADAAELDRQRQVKTKSKNRQKAKQQRKSRKKNR